ncbi:MAG: sensor histidine kinase [Gemmatimonadaceae bacterium]
MNAAVPTPQRVARPARSIRLRLTLWYAGTILVLLLAATLVARTLVRTSLEREFARSMSSSTAIVQSFFRVEIAEYRQIAPTLDHIAGELVIPDRRIEFITPEGRVHQPNAFVRVAPTQPLAAPVRERVVPLNPELAPGWQIRLAASAEPLIRQQRQIDRWALLAVPLAFGLALLAGWVLTGRTLQPVSAMADAADRITADAQGRLPIAVADDELGRLGTRFNALLDRLDAALGNQRRFLADAAHELRTPIARARGIGELALAAPPGSADDRSALEQTRAELETMSRLADELLELARADATAAPAKLEPIFLDDIVADATSAFEALARTRGIRLVVDVPDEVPIRGEALTLARLVGILVDNAIRYSHPGGTVTVRARGNPAQLEVIDEGIGIAPEERARLFERFFRGAEARRLVPDGSGLGLAIAASIVRRHGARMEFGETARSEDANTTASAPHSRGTRVVLDFPTS